MTDLKEFQRFEQKPFVRERNVFSNTFLSLTKGLCSKNWRILWDQSLQLWTFKLFTLFITVYAVLYTYIVDSMFLRSLQKQRSNISVVVQTTDWISEINKSFIIWLYWNIIDNYKGKERQIKTCNSIVISYKISSLTSLCIVTIPLLIVRNTFSLHILSKILIFIRHRQAFFKFPLPLMKP